MRVSLFLLFLLTLNVAIAETSPTTARYALKYDFSSLLLPKTPFMGFTDTAAQHLEIKYKSVTKGSDPLLYNLSGTSKVKGNVCTFKGTIHIEEINEFTELHYGINDAFKDKQIRAEGELIGAYEIKEDPSKKNCGIFTGKVKLLWYVDKSGDVAYDDIDKAKDTYGNNQYTGMWRAYNSDDKKTANWGEYHVPN